MAGLHAFAVASQLLVLEPSEARTVVVAPLEVDGRLPDEAATSLQAHLVEGVGRAGVVAAPGGPSQRGPRCNAECLVRLAREHGTSHVLRLKVRKAGRDFHTTLELIEGRDGSVVAHVEQTCGICGLEEVGSLVAADAAALGRKLGALDRGATLNVTSRPAGATVVVDGREAGVSPVDLILPAGPHSVTIRLEGHFDREREVSLVDGVAQAVDFELQAVPSERTKPGTLGVVGIPLLAVGLAAVGSGAALVAIHHRPVPSRCNGDAIDINGLCRYRYETLAGGIPLIAAGAVAAISGAVLIGVGTRRGWRLKRRGALVPTPWGLAGRF